MNFITVWGGTGQVKTRDSFFYVDHVRVSLPNCGGTCGVPPPPPPTTIPPPPPPTTSNPGTVADLAASQIGSTSLTLTFSQVSDGAGAPAKYDVRFGAPGTNWGEKTSVAQGSCSTPLQGTAVSGPLSCTVAGLAPSTGYEFQLISYRGTLNQGAVYGGFSNVAAAATAAASAGAADVNGDGSITIADVQLAINQAVGLQTCGSADVNSDGQCSITDVQRVVNAALDL